MKWPYYVLENIRTKVIVKDLRDHIKRSGKFAIFTRLKIGSQTPSFDPCPPQFLVS